jgi:hypothetical protein
MVGISKQRDLMRRQENALRHMIVQRVTFRRLIFSICNVRATTSASNQDGDVFKVAQSRLSSCFMLLLGANRDKQRVRCR